MEGVRLFEKFDFRISRHSEIESLDVRKSKSNKTEMSNTDGVRKKTDREKNNCLVKTWSREAPFLLEVFL